MDNRSRVGRSHLFPAFPYYAYTKLSDDDVKALYAYLMTRPAVSATTPANTVPFPLKIRAFQEGWKLLFFRSGRCRTDPSKSDQWNRGAYLAEAVADCSGCHTARNFLGAEKTHNPYAGYEVDGWIAPALTAANPSPIPWTEEELFTYLRTGASPLHGATAATMTAVIRDSLALAIVPDSDIRAIAVYIADMDHASARGVGIETTTREALGTSDLGIGQEHDSDADLYVSACISVAPSTTTSPPKEKTSQLSPTPSALPAADESKADRGYVPRQRSEMQRATKTVRHKFQRATRTTSTRAAHRGRSIELFGTEISRSSHLSARQSSRVLFTASSVRATPPP